MEKNAPEQTTSILTTAFFAMSLFWGWKWAAAVVLITGLSGIFSPWLSLRIHTFWMKISAVTSAIFPPVILTAIYFLVLFPLSVFSRLAGEKDPLVLKNRKAQMFFPVEKVFGKEDFEKIW
ncbi:MAG: hypothetical protein R3C61_10400 [Bacteroidia bacterium]